MKVLKRITLLYREKDPRTQGTIARRHPTHHHGNGWVMLVTNTADPEASLAYFQERHPEHVWKLASC